MGVSFIDSIKPNYWKQPTGGYRWPPVAVSMEGAEAEQGGGGGENGDSDDSRWLGTSGELEEH
jgi:hypothetical protein